MNQELMRIRRLLRWRAIMYLATAADAVFGIALCALALVEHTALILLPIAVAAFMTLPLTRGARAVSQRAGIKALRLAPRLAAGGPIGGKGPRTWAPAEAPC